MNKLLITFFLLTLSNLALAKEPSSRTITETFGDWKLVCIEESKNKQCEIKQTLVNENRQIVAVIAVGKQDDNKHIIQITLPLLLDLTKAVSLTVDENAPITLPFNFCNNTACFVLIEDKTIFNAFTNGNVGSIRVNAFGVNKSLNMNYSLKGFSAALKSLKSQS